VDCPTREKPARCTTNKLAGLTRKPDYFYAITPESISYILISDKNHFGKKLDTLRKQYLNKELILGRPNAKGAIFRTK
jgi:hypothetical protein